MSLLLRSMTMGNYINLLEDKRSQYTSKSRVSDKEMDGKTRFEKRMKSKTSTSNREYNQIDMNKLFKDRILTVGVPVRGETDNYVVKISFGGIIDTIQKRLEQNGGVLDLKTIIRAIIDCFNREDIYVHCTCPDFKYRHAYWLTVKGLNSGDPENRPSKITNPRDTKGPGCKHIMLVLNNNKWIMKVASVIYNYINYVQKHYEKQYADIIYPALYNKEYEEPVQLSFDDEETPDISKANEYARTKNQWTSDTNWRWTKSNNDEEDGQQNLFNNKPVYDEM